MLFLFEDFTLDGERRELRAKGAVVPVEPQVFDLLVYLIENRGRVLSKDDLIASVWGGRIVSDSTLDSRINAVRKVLGDSGKEQRLIRTATRKGIRFVGEVVEKADKNVSASAKSFSVHSRIGGGEAGATVQATPAPPRLSMIVLPFTNLGSGPEQGYFVDGVTESLTTDLSRISGATVIARNTAFAYRDKTVDVRALGRDLNIRYVLEGSVQKSGDRMRVNVQLIEAETAAHLWAERFDKPIAELFDMQDEIVARIANQLSAEIVRSRGAPGRKSCQSRRDRFLAARQGLDQSWHQPRLVIRGAQLLRTCAWDRPGERRRNSRARHRRRDRDTHGLVCFAVTKPG